MNKSNFDKGSELISSLIEFFSGIEKIAQQITTLKNQNAEMPKQKETILKSDLE